MAEQNLEGKPKVAYVFPGQVAYVFPGQGAQRLGMGCKLYESSATARMVFQEADEVLGFPLSRLCFEGPEESLRQTVNAQPAIMAVSIACLKAALETGGPDGAMPPAFVAGHSLGEFTALVAAGVLDFAGALRLVRERGRLMQEAGESQPGGMVAIIGLDEASLGEVCQEAGAQIANINCPGQIVISGNTESLARAADLARARGAQRAIPLQVSGAFHSALMQPSQEGMARALSSLSFRDPVVPIVANTTARPLTSADEVKAELLRQLCSCVHWQRSVEYMLQAGVSAFIEIGPGQVLSGLIRRISKEAETLTINDVGRETPRA